MKWVRAIGRTAYAADGTPRQFDGVTLDVTSQKRAEASLRESERRFRVVADAAPVLIWLRGADKLCFWFNLPWLEFTGRSMAEEVGNGGPGVPPTTVSVASAVQCCFHAAPFPWSTAFEPTASSAG